uniref:DUF7906 domain-containing protein n=1 Tax=Physcomitrium patens TaxID=3218 RepID=A0A7I4EYT4_PHYPA
MVCDSNHDTTCLGTFLLVVQWIDIAAGPVEFGPSTSGEGYFSFYNYCLGFGVTLNNL